MKKFPSIEQFRHVVRAERDAAAYEDRPVAKRVYRGTVKLHGTNAGVTLKPDGSLVFQSRNRVLAVGDDNAGFVHHWTDADREAVLRDTIHLIALNNNIEPSVSEITIFGEWCGQGIQKGVALNQLEKMYVVFAAHADDRWLDLQGVNFDFAPVRLFSIFQFPTYQMEIDFNTPELAQNDLVALTERVEQCCPVGATFGVEGIGEGIVWSPVDGDRSSKYWFKVKGEKHSVSKVAKLASVDVERFRARDDLVKALVTDNRLQQGLDYLAEQNITLELPNIGTYLRWVFNDIIKEEADTIAENGFEQKELGKPISDIAKRYFMIALNEKALAA